MGEQVILKKAKQPEKIFFISIYFFLTQTGEERGHYIKIGEKMKLSRD